MPETPYPENEHDKLEDSPWYTGMRRNATASGHSAAWHEGFAYYYKGGANIYDVAGAELNLSKDWERGWLAAQAEDEAVDGSPLDIGA